MQLRARAERADEARVFLETDHMLPALTREEVGAHGRKRLDDSAVHAAVDDAVALQVLVADRHLAAHLIFGRVGNGHAHCMHPSLRDLVKALGEVLGHRVPIVVTEKSEGRIAPTLTRLRSQCYRLRLQEPDSEMEALEVRSYPPPELPAGKRGGWHHDWVYPKLRLTSFAPRALNFAANSTE